MSLTSSQDSTIESLRTAAEAHMAEGRWGEAAAALGRIPQRALADNINLHLSRNFAALLRHRPALYDIVSAAPRNLRFKFAAGKDGRPTLADCANPQRPLFLSPGGDPIQALTGAMRQLDPMCRQGTPLGLYGLGDGYVLNALARHRPKLFLTQQQAVHVIEPSAELVATAMMLHDLSGPDGPIEQARFQWWVGEDWSQRLEAAILTDPMLPPPLARADLGATGEQIGRDMHRVSESLVQRMAQVQQQLEHYYAGKSTERLVHRFAAARPSDKAHGKAHDRVADKAGRRPRVMLVTTRFSTVLQYATRDAAKGFEYIGWEARVVIEPSDHHRISALALRDAMLSFKPDLVFQIDHLRQSTGEVYPANLPVACWIQDHLPHLTNKAAGAAVGPNDFVLTFASPMFTDTYGYPAAQCIDMPMMLTSAPAAATDDGAQLTSGAAEAAAAATGATSHRSSSSPHHKGRGCAVPDLVYVSNVSGLPARMIDSETARAPAQLQRLLLACLHHLNHRYACGQSVATYHDLRQLIAEVEQHTRYQPVDDAARSKLVELLWNPMNITLYRQQALRWAADAADHLGLTLGIYGRGWEDNPHFGRYARGIVEHGVALQKLTRSAKIGLNLEPYACFTHQRLLDGLMAGGFFLVRRHPTNALLQELCNYVIDHFDDSIQTSAQALEAVAPAQREALENLLRRSACVSWDGGADPVRQVRCWQRAGVLVRQEQALPRLDEISFDDAESCRSLMERFVADAALRAELSNLQRDNIGERLSFAAGMRRVVDQIGSRLAQRQHQQPGRAARLAG